jgi:ABC-2 type transport system ATP-binding protein
VNTALALDHVTKQFGGLVALYDVTLSVPTGVVFALLGENGAGKTTAIRILLGLAEADGGSAHVLGLDSRTQDLEIRQRVGYVSEQPTLYDWMTVTEIGWFAAGFYGGNYLDSYRRLADQYHLPPGQKLKGLSKGMRAKVALSLALAHDPELLILDEPTSGLDPLVRREFLESMVDRAATGKTVFLSSHQITEVERVADYVAILHQGKLAIVAPLEELKSQIRELTVTLRDGSELPTAVPGEVLRQRRRARQWQLLIKGDHDAADAVRAHTGVEHVDLRVPTLEEIFVAYVAPPAAEGNGQTNESREVTS